MSLFCAPVRAGAGRFAVFPLSARLSGVALLVRVVAALVQVVAVLVRVVALVQSVAALVRVVAVLVRGSKTDHSFKAWLVQHRHF